MSDDLKQFAVSDAFVQYDEKGVVEGIYRGYIQEPDPFTPGDMRIAYKIESKDGKVRALTSKSKRLAREFLKVDPKDGDLIRIVRSGAMFKTNFILTNLSTDIQAPVQPVENPAQTEEVKPDEIPF